jgi:predicted transposase/invertase (TIGR01784 family)
VFPGIDPKIDYAFKRLFGREQNRALLIQLIEAVLQPARGERIADLEILNPFNEKETLDDKLSVVDVKARDERGRLFNIEMQMLAPAFFPKRILYYWARLHQQQLREGENYLALQPTISISFVNSILFPNIADHHLRFGLLNAAHQVTFTDDLVVHLVELPKFTRTPEQLAEPLDVWLFFLRHAESLDTDALPAPLQVPAIRQAMEELRMLTQDDLERERYEARMKVYRDALSLIKANELALQEAERKAREGEQQALEKGEKIGIIHLCQRRLNRPPTSREELLTLPLVELRRLAEQLENELPG